MYSIRIQEDNNPYHKLRCLDDDNEEILISTIVNLPGYDLHRMYFSIDTRHDKTSSGPPVDDWAISEAFKTHSERFNAIRIIKMTKKLFSEMKDITNFATQFRGEVEYIENSSTNKKMDFQVFIKNELQIELSPNQGQPLPPVPITGATPTLSSCIKDNPAGIKRVALYQYLKFFNIFDQGHQFPDKIPSPSYIIDSASTINTLDKVPNMCDSINFNDYALPGTGAYVDPNNRNLSLLFFGDLQIVDFYYGIMGLDLIIDGPNNGISIDENSFFSMTAPAGIGAHTGMTDAHKKLIYCSVIALNIFWQYVLSYVKIYTDLHNKDNVSESVKILRHWVFTYVELNNNTQKPEFKGKFFKTINNTSDHITKIPFWFLQNHDELVATPFVRNEMKDQADPTKIYSMNVSQSSCAKLINSIYPGTAVLRSTIDPPGTILKAIEHYFEANDATQTYKIHMGQILKFSGDKSHQTASELLNRVFKIREAFKDMIGCVNTGDRPLTVGCILDNRPFIMPDVSVRMIDDFGYKRTTEDEIYIAFYIPKTKITILDRIKQKVREINSYISNIKELCQYNYEPVKIDNLKNELKKTIYHNMAYIHLFYLSFFSFQINDDDFIAPGQAPDLATVAATHNINITQGNRIHGASIAYILKQNTQFVLDYTKLSNEQFLGQPAGPPVFKFKLDDIPNSLLPSNKELSESIVKFNRAYSTIAWIDIFDAYQDNLTKPNSYNLEHVFMGKLVLPTTLGGNVQQPPLPPATEPNKWPDHYITGIPKISFPSPSLDLLTLYKGYKTEETIHLKEPHYNTMFSGATSPIPPPLDTTKYYDNIFMYNKEYEGKTHALITVYIPLLNVVNIHSFYGLNPPTMEAYFTFTKDEYETKSGKHYRMKPFIDIRKKNDTFENKLSYTLNSVASDRETNVSLNYEMVFMRLTEYIQSICRMFEINNSMSNEVKATCESNHCMRIIHFSLTFFHHSSTLEHIDKTLDLFKASTSQLTNFKNTLHAATPPPQPSVPIEVIGLFSTTTEGSFNASASASTRPMRGNASPGDKTKIEGHYYINRTHLQERFNELKTKLKLFLELNEKHNTSNKYKDIKII